MKYNSTLLSVLQDSLLACCDQPGGELLVPVVTVAFKFWLKRQRSAPRPKHVHEARKLELLFHWQLYAGRTALIIFRFVLALRFCWHEFNSPWTLGELSRITFYGTKECTQLVQLCALLGCDSFGNNVLAKYLLLGKRMFGNGTYFWIASWSDRENGKYLRTVAIFLKLEECGRRFAAAVKAAENW